MAGRRCFYIAGFGTIGPFFIQGERLQAEQFAECRPLYHLPVKKTMVPGGKNQNQTAALTLRKNIKFGIKKKISFTLTTM
jgi:hypothetical protein